MAEGADKILAAFATKMRQLMLFCDSLKIENDRLKRELSQKNKDIDLLEHEVKQLKLKYDNLKFAKSFSNQDNEERELAKKRLLKLVRDVDKCISILKN